MNHPTTEIDELLSLANEALEDGDTEQAIEALRSASRLAPLRKDIKNELAKVLEGNVESLRNIKTRASRPKETPSNTTDDDSIDFPNDGSGFKDTIEEVAQKAFKFATGTTSATTTKLTNLVSEGIKSLKFSAKSPTNIPADRYEKEPIELANKALLNSHTELDEYLEREEDYIDEEYAIEENQIASNRALESKQTRSPRKKKSVAVEDVITEKMAHTFQQLARADRQKLALTVSYLTLLIFTGVACYKVGQKFPAIRGLAPAAATSLATQPTGDASSQPNALALDAVPDPLQESAQLLAQGNRDKAITVLMGSLSTSLSAPTKTKVNNELSSLFSKRGTENLSNSKFKESVADYKKALEYDPSNHQVMLLLGNALYYSASPDPSDVKKIDKSKLQEAAKALENALIYDQSNQEGYAVLARTYGKLGDSTKAKTAWQKVINNEKSSSDLKKEAKQFLSK